MKKEEYDSIINEIRSMESVQDCRYCMAVLTEKFAGVPEITLRSIFSQEYLKLMKYSNIQHQGLAEKYFELYSARKQGDGNVLLLLAQELNLAPTLLARLVLEKHYEKKSALEGDTNVSRAFITKLLRDTTLIDDKNLAHQVYTCILRDDQYGPISDTVNHSLGQQYEHLLARLLSEKKIPFQNEEQMREQGFDKTPDIKLELPIAVNGFVVNWIESKALFGSEEWHQRFHNKQLSTYWNRYGPGMVIYWFDFVDSIVTSHNKQLLICNHLPENIVQMNIQKGNCTPYVNKK